MKNNDNSISSFTQTKLEGEMQYLTLKSILIENSKESKGKAIKELSKHIPKNTWMLVISEKDEFSPRTGHTLIKISTGLLLFGGMDEMKVKKNDSYLFNFKTLDWEIIEIKGDLPTPRSGAKEAQITDESFVIFGGSAVGEHFSNELYFCNMKTKLWSTLEGKGAPLGRTDHVLLRYQKNLYVFGGQGERRTIFNDLHRFSLEKGNWKKIKTEGAIVKGRFGHTASVFKDSMFIFGGWDGWACLDDFLEYSFTTNIFYEIRRTSGKRPSPRYRHDSIVIGDKLFLYGGVDHHQRRYNDLYEFCFVQKNWINLTFPGFSPTKRSFHRISSYENIIFIVGGFDGNRLNDMYALSISNDDNKFPEFVGNTTFSQISLSEDLENKVRKDEAELVEYLNRQVKEISKSLQTEEEKNLCKICFSREIDAVLQDCCHFVLCIECAGQINMVREFVIKCPICRANVVRVIKTTTV